MGRSSERPNGPMTRRCAEFWTAPWLSIVARVPKLRFASLSSQLARPEFRSLTGVRGPSCSCGPTREGLSPVLAGRSVKGFSVLARRGYLAWRRRNAALTTSEGERWLWRTPCPRTCVAQASAAALLMASGARRRSFRSCIGATVTWRDVHCGVRRSIGGWRIDELLFFRNFNGQGPAFVASGRWSTLVRPISKELTCSINL